MASQSADDRAPWELEWVRLHSFLRQSGYETRARYQPDWVPSWSKSKKSSVSTTKYEDGIRPRCYAVLDAIRTRDAMPVYMKMLQPDDHSAEHAQFFSERPRNSDPRNHCVPLLDILRPYEQSDRIIMVMPRYVPWNVWSFKRIGEGVEFFSQIFEGLKFMHDHDFAHLDIGRQNILMDALHLYQEPCHPSKPKRVLNGYRKARHRERYQSPRPVKYYYIDFDQSVHFETPEDRRFVARSRRADKSVPEEVSDYTRPCDPFAVDVYCLGNLLRLHWLEAYTNTEFIRPLVEDMVQTEPTLRPTAREVVERFEIIRASLPPKELTRALRRNMEYFTNTQLVRRVLAADAQARKTRAKELAAQQGRPYGLREHVLYLLRGRPKATLTVAESDVSKDVL